MRISDWSSDVCSSDLIGMAVAGILSGFGCRLLAYDPAPDPGLTALGGRYVELPELLSGADVITLHCPLTPATRHMIGADAVAMMKPGVMLINTDRKSTRLNSSH